MYICNMINRCAPHEKKKRRNQEKMVIQDAVRFPFPLTGTAKVTSSERSWETLPG